MSKSREVGLDWLVTHMEVTYRMIFDKIRIPIGLRILLKPSVIFGLEKQIQPIEPTAHKASSPLRGFHDKPRLCWGNLKHNQGRGMVYKYLIPIGDNCEIGGHLTRNGYTFSSIFRYAACSLSQVCKCFEHDFRDIFSYDNIIPVTVKGNMVECKKYNISWHTNFVIQRKDGVCVFKNKSKDQYDREISKLHHLIGNVQKALTDNENKTLFIYKSNKGDFSEFDNFVNIIESKYPELNFELLVVKDRNQILSSKNNRIKIQNVDYLAPYNDAMLSGDCKNWNKILSSYIKVPDYSEILFKTFRRPKGNEVADYLRDIALKFEAIDDFDTAYALMKHASYCRPTGPIIIKKLEEYIEKVNQKK
jgi:hypothetical protein